jgi:hypothetical protein
MILWCRLAPGPAISAVILARPVTSFFNLDPVLCNGHNAPNPENWFFCLINLLLPGNRVNRTWGHVLSKVRRLAGPAEIDSGDLQ